MKSTNLSSTPLVCFYKNQFIISTDFTHKQKSPNQATEEFLKLVGKDYPNNIKILQIDFDAFPFNAASSSDLNKVEKLKHYESPKSQAFILHRWEILDPSQFTKKTELPLQFSPCISKSQFLDSIEKIKNDILSGRFYQINFTSSFTANQSVADRSTYDLFQYYFPKFQSPYSALLPCGNFDILCFSPELFVRKTGTRIISQPIKGTGKAYQEILESEKESAELSMIVDLIRNDLHLISDSPVEVTRHRAELSLKYASHTYSEITATTSKRLPEILSRMLPGGSISGCPKSEAVLAISEIESFQRQFYTGCIGWCQGDDFELNITIRSILKANDQLFYYAGCGIVSDSDPESEWNELLKKASALS